MTPTAATRKTGPAFMGDLIRRFRGPATAAGFLALLAAFIATVLMPGYRLADRLSESTAALKLVSEQRGQPEAMLRSLAVIRDRLRSGGYVGDAVAELAVSKREYDLAIVQLRQTIAPGSQELQRVEKAWADNRALLEPVTAFSGIPYRDSDRAGTQLNASGQRLMADTRKALAYGRKNAAGLVSDLATVGARLEGEAVAGAATLRRLMIAGTIFAGFLLALVARFQWLKAREERSARDARQQTRDILEHRQGRTLPDRQGFPHRQDALGSPRGALPARLVRRTAVSKTCSTGSYPRRRWKPHRSTSKLLWGDRANENLIKSINPLAEVEVTFDNGNAGRDIRYLEFDFHRVKQDGAVRQILVSVSDVTSRVLLSREVKQSQASADAQMDLLLAILQVESGQLETFLSDCNASLRMVNSVLKVPARSDADFRRKVDSLFREMHKIKGDAATLGVATVESRAHAFEDMLNDLRERAELSGQRLPAARRASRRPVRASAGDTGVARPARQPASHFVAGGNRRRRRFRTGRRARRRDPARRLSDTLETLAARLADESWQEGPARHDRTRPGAG